MLPVLDSTTTIELKRVVMDRLRSYRRRSDRSWNDTFERMMKMMEGGEADFYFKFITVDGFIADSSDHDIVFQVGGGPEDAPGTARYYRFRNGKFEELKELPKIKVEVS